LALAAATGLSCRALAQQEPAPERGSLLEDRAARKLLEAGDARLEAGEPAKAVEVWQSVIERYPRSRVRFDAHMRLGNHLLKRDRAYDRARNHFEAVAAEENPDEAQRANATLSMGVCFYEVGNYGKCFQIMRDVIENFPVSPEVNQAYYYIGLGHFRLGHYSRAIQALEKVGTTLSSEDKKGERVEAGKRLFVRIEDADLAALEQDETVPVKVEAGSGDVETIKCYPIGRNVRIVLGSVQTGLGVPKPGNGRLELRGGDKVTVSYIDRHTKDGKAENMVTRVIGVVGTATAGVTDGAFAETLGGVVLGKAVNVQVIDADFDRTDGADVLKATVSVLREKTPEELAAEAATAPADAETKPDRYKPIDKVDVVLTEAAVARTISADEEGKEPAEPAPEDKTVPPGKDALHSGVFRASVPLAKAEEVVANDNTLQAMPGDLVQVTYIDEQHMGDEPRTLTYRAKVVEGSLGGVRVTQTQISDQELRVKTQLRTAEALTNIGNRYKEFGLKDQADAKYQQALKLCEETSGQARKLGGRLLEETYVQMWKIYYEMDKLELAAAVSARLQREFPNSEFVDDALLSLAQVARKQGQTQRAIGIYGTLVRMEKSQLRGEAQYGIAECYEEMAKNAQPAAAAQLQDRAFQEYKKVYDQFPDSGRVGEAVSKMANYYYQQKDYARAVDTFENVLRSYPDAKFLDVILFNYGRCLYRMDRRADARRQFDQLIGDFPESSLAPDAKKISEALRKAGF
jgi:TolA-binding protein